MHRIDTKTAQKDKFGAGKNGFTRGNPQTGTPATDLDDDYFDMLQEELCSVVEASGASLEKARHDQLLTALRALLLSRKNPFGDIKSDGTVKTALENLGIGEIYAPINSPSFTGTPCVPTADQSEIDFRIANTAFVAQAIAILNGGAPAALNTLKKLALAINNDASFYSTVNNALGQKAALSDFTYSKTSSSVVGNQPGGLRFMCGETSVPTDSNGNVFITLPDTFLNRVVYAEAHQSKGSYTADVDPFIFSSYPTSNGPTSTISFAVRNSKTGVPLINSAITLQYFVKGY
ncbi:Phage tail protein [Escherichia coli]